MQTKRNPASQQNTVPIPQAAMVIDIRTGKDDLLKMLRLEIENLATEKQEHRINHWQYLADFIDFQSISPLDQEDIKAIWERIAKDNQHKTGTPPDVTADANGATNGKELSKQQSFTLKWQKTATFNQEPHDDEEDEQPDAPVLPEEYQECTRRINTIRNKRHDALSDLGKKGRLGKNKKDARTHLIFITDAMDNNSLKSASAFAAYLEQYYRGRLEHSGYESVLVTSVICMNHPNTAEVPRILINNLRRADKKESWTHINALIINEAYRVDGGWLDVETQSYMTELLLYTMLVVEPIELNRLPDVPLNPSAVKPDEQTVKERRELHPQTFIFGLSTIEHSSRWGRLYLNTALAAQTMQLLHMPGIDSHVDIDNKVHSWFDNWRQDVKEAVPQHIPGDFPYRNALEIASKAAKPATDVFPEHDPRHNIEQRSINSITTYADQLIKAHEQLQQDQSQSIVHALNKLWEKDESNRLVKAYKRSQRVLSEFFSGATGSITRARFQLEVLSDVIAHYNRDRKPIDFDQMRDEILRLKEERIQAFRDHCDDFPILQDHPILLTIVIIITLLLCAFTGVVAALAGYTVIHHLAYVFSPTLASALDASLPGISFLSLGSIILILLIIIAVALTLYFPYRRIVRRGRRSRATPIPPREVAWTTEIIFAAALVIFAIFGFIVSALVTNFAQDQGSLDTLSWMADIRFWSWLALIVALVCIVAETIHYIVWYRMLLDLRVQAIEDLRAQHQQNLKMIHQHLSDTVALDLLRRAGLTDGQGGRGSYFKRISKLNTDLAKVELEIGDQLKLASNRLLEQHVTLQYRKELLDVKEVAAQSQKLTSELSSEAADLQEFAEILLRVMGEEVPAEIESQLRDERVTGGTQQFWRPSYLDRRSLRHIQVLTAIITAVALRLVIEIPQYDAISPLDARFREISELDPDYQVTLKTLLERMQNYNKEIILNNLRGQPLNPDDYQIQFILQALTLWSQIFWIHKDNALDELLKSQDIFDVLKKQGFNPQTIWDTLIMRVNLGGRPRIAGMHGVAHLIAPPSAEGFKYILGMDHRFDREMIYDSPDIERFSMLFLHRYPALPLIIRQENTALLSPPANAASGTPHTAADTIQPVSEVESVVVSPSVPSQIVQPAASVEDEDNVASPPIPPQAATPPVPANTAIDASDVSNPGSSPTTKTDTTPGTQMIG